MSVSMSSYRARLWTVVVLYAAIVFGVTVGALVGRWSG